jgi:hypothetical protein
MSKTTDKIEILEKDIKDINNVISNILIILKKQKEKISKLNTRLGL